MNYTTRHFTWRRWITQVATIFGVWMMIDVSNHHPVAHALSSNSMSLSWKLPSIPTTNKIKNSSSSTDTTESPSLTTASAMCPMTLLMTKQKKTTPADFDPFIVADYEKGEEELIPLPQTTNKIKKWMLLGLIGTTVAATGFMIASAATNTAAPTLMMFPNNFISTTTATAGAAAAATVSSNKSIWSSWKGWSTLSLLVSSSASASSSHAIKRLEIWNVLQRSVIQSLDKMNGMFGKTLRKMLLMELWFHVWKHPNSPLSVIEDYIQKDLFSDNFLRQLKSIAPHWLRRGTNKLVKKGLERTLERAAFQFVETIYSSIYEKIVSIIWPVPKQQAYTSS